jgi:serine/threonine protein phosphatase 1
MSKIFAIGDIHGCKYHLDRMMAMLDINSENDTLIFIGDYIDRGPDSKGVVDTLLDIKKRIKNAVFLKGNHEQMLLDCINRGEKKPFMDNGGMKTLSSYDTNEFFPMLPSSHIEFFNTLKTWHMTDGYIFVHAGLRPGIPLERQDTEDLIWIREAFIHSPHNFGKIVVFGHTPISFSTPLIDKDKIGLDTGAVYGGKLTCIELTSREVYQV